MGYSTAFSSWLNNQHVDCVLLLDLLHVLRVGSGFFLSFLSLLLEGPPVAKGTGLLACPYQYVLLEMFSGRETAERKRNRLRVYTLQPSPNAT